MLYDVCDENAKNHVFFFRNLSALSSCYDVIKCLTLSVKYNSILRYTYERLRKTCIIDIRV